MLLKNLKGVQENMGLQHSLPKQEEKTETLGVFYELDCNNCFKKYINEAGKKLKERIKEHNNDGGKIRKDKKITGFSQLRKTTGIPPAWDEVRIIYKENSHRKRKFKEATKRTPYNKEQLINKNERNSISNLWKLILNDKT